MTFSDKVYRAKYEAHLKHIRDWCEIDLEATRVVRQRLYDRARRQSGAAPETKTITGLSDASRDRLRLELAALATAQDSGEEGDV
ncbi:hypothetical protein BD414DRAFT_577910 [Trametes punicea]|nr:hypothetical protein BD414DRAFT_577910 [Trametes punicea]